MWKLTEIDNPLSSQLWFSDGKPITDVRGGSGDSSRMIVDGHGFLDITELQLPPSTIVDLNGAFIPYGNVTSPSTIDPSDASHPWLLISLRLPGDGTFQAVGRVDATDTVVISVSGKLKPLPSVSASDATFLKEMISKKYVPYQNIPDSPGKTDEEIKALGLQLFPFSPHSYELAMAVYDWTTASFARMVFMKIFQYTGIPPTPYPLDQASIAKMIWESNWGTYVPSNADYMNSFMMKPASSEQDVYTQLLDVASELHQFSAVQNRLMSAAVHALPRTSVLAKQQLFSGQVDIYQLGLDRFGIEFLECHLNAGPVSQSLEISFATAMASYISPGNTITTKMVWSFTDSIEDALHYSNGIVLVANPPDDRSWVWETAAHITPLSDDPAKTEYTFVPGSQFKVVTVSQETVSGKQVAVITLDPLPPTRLEPSGPNRREELVVAPLPAEALVRRAEAYAAVRPLVELFHERDAEEKGISLDDAIPLHKKLPDATHFRLTHRTRGRRCACIDELENKLSA